MHKDEQMSLDGIGHLKYKIDSKKADRFFQYRDIAIRSITLGSRFFDKYNDSISHDGNNHYKVKFLNIKIDDDINRYIIIKHIFEKKIKCFLIFPNVDFKLDYNEITFTEVKREFISFKT